KDKIKNREMKGGYACDDGVGLHYINEQLEAVISSRAHAFAYKYTLENEALWEEKIDPIRLVK
ncbi:MAG: hypothetical protein AAFO94_17745, partial [Bacteroidota bacterium]